MPLYEYRCPDGHLRSELRRMFDREAPLTCECGLPATPILSVTAPGKVVGSTTPVKAQGAERPVIRETGHSLTLIDWSCTCGQKSYEVYDGRPEAAPVCACGLTMSEVIGVPEVDWFTKAASGNVNGIWCDAAGRYFTSKGDRQRWMDENNLMDWNDLDDDAVYRKASERSRENDEYCARMTDEFDHDPALLRLREEGRIPDWNNMRPEADVR